MSGGLRRFKTSTILRHIWSVYLKFTSEAYIGRFSIWSLYLNFNSASSPSSAPFESQQESSAQMQRYRKVRTARRERERERERVAKGVAMRAAKKVADLIIRTLNYSNKFWQCHDSWLSVQSGWFKSSNTRIIAALPLGDCTSYKFSKPYATSLTPLALRH